MRIVSLLPSATEIVCALGLGGSLVGISHDCDYPPEIRGRPVLSEAIVTTDLPSPVIDARIREQVHRGRSVYHLDEAELARLEPDLILTQELCEVCAPSYTEVTRAAKILSAPTRIVSLEPLGLFDVLENILLVGQIAGARERAAALVERLRARIERVRERVRGLPRPRVACLEWLEPLFVGGHWVPEMVEIAGGRDVLGTPRAHSTVIAWDDVVASEPEVLVAMPCGFDVARTRRETGLLTGRPGWRDLPAVREGRVFLTDASSYFNRPGPRLVDGVDILAAILHGVPCDVPPGAFERL